MLWMLILRLLAIVAAVAIGYYIYRQIRYHKEDRRVLTQKIRDIVRVAATHGGRITVSQIAFELDIALEEAEALMNIMTKRGMAELSIEEDGGEFVYEVFLARTKKGAKSSHPGRHDRISEAKKAEISAEIP